MLAVVVSVAAALAVAGAQGQSYLTMPTPWAPGGGNNPAASNVAPCGGGQSGGTSTVVAGYPFWAMWAENGQSQTTQQITFNLLAVDQGLSDMLNFQTAPFFTQTIGGARTEITIPANTPGGLYTLQWVWNGYYSCASLDVVAQTAANGFPSTVAVLNGAPNAHQGTLTAGQMDLIGYHPTPVMNTPQNPNAEDNPPFSRVTITAPSGNAHAILSATSWMFNNLDRQRLREAMPTPTVYDERTDTMDSGTGTVGLCRRVNNQQNVNNQQEFFFGVSAGPAAAGEQYTVDVTEYNAYVAADNDLTAQPHNGPMYFWTDASSSPEQERSVIFTADDFDSDFRAEMSENCEMASNNNNMVYQAARADGTTYCIDLPEEQTDKYIRIEKSSVSYRVGIELNSCSDISAANPTRAVATVGLAAVAAANAL